MNNKANGGDNVKMSQGENSYILINRDLRMLQVQLSYRDFKEDGWYFAECPELRMMDQGKTKKEAYRNLVSLVLTNLVVAVETGYLDDYLKALGFSFNAARRLCIFYSADIKRGLAHRFRLTLDIKFLKNLPGEIGVPVTA